MKALLPSSGLNIKLSLQQDVGIKPTSFYLLGLVFDREDGSSTFLQKVNEVLLDYMASHPRIVTTVISSNQMKSQSDVLLAYIEILTWLKEHFKCHSFIQATWLMV